MSRESYLEHDRTHDGKHEFVNGEVVAMGGAGPAHNIISANLISALHAGLQARPCVVFTADQRVNVRTTGLYCYPDVTVACGEHRFSNENPPSLLNPTFLAEVLSPSTENYDRGAKAAHFRRLESLQGYLLLSSTERHVELYVRSGLSWTFSEARGEEVLEVRPLELSLSLPAVYRGAPGLDLAVTG
jgi:Uma2 family endonuclease